jgi:hypothetical protein
VRINVTRHPSTARWSPNGGLCSSPPKTVKSGYDKFIIVNGQSGFRSDALAEIPGQASGSYGPYGGSFSASGPQTIRRNRYQTEVIIKMFKADDPQGRDAVDARVVLKTASNG